MKKGLFRDRFGHRTLKEHREDPGHQLRNGSGQLNLSGGTFFVFLNIAKDSG